MVSNIRLHVEKGFSLIELLIVLFVFTFIVGGLFNILGRSQNRYQFEQEVADIQQVARNCLDLMEREIRLAGFPKETYYDSSNNWTATNSNRVARFFLDPSNPDAGTATSPTSMLFEGDIDEDGVVESVRYRLNGTDLERSAVDKASGATPATDYRAIAQNVTAATFTYLDSGGATTANSSLVRAVRIQLQLTTASRDPESRRLRTVSVQTTALIRN
jgi:prepilin-type N-terminal cleavage/methylation domain-containing protein